MGDRRTRRRVLCARFSEPQGRSSADAQARPTLALLGLSNFALNRPLGYLLAPILFTGPLYEAYLDAELPGQANWKWQFGLVEKRNYVVVRLTCRGGGAQC